MTKNQRLLQITQKMKKMTANKNQSLLPLSSAVSSTPSTAAAPVVTPLSNDYTLKFPSVKIQSTKDSNSRVLYHTPRIIISPEVLAKVFFWVDTCPIEISGLGKVEIIRYPQSGNMPEQFDFKIVDAILLKQENTAAFTEIDPTAASKALFETKDMPGQLRWVWHSHVNMGVFWSGTDFETITSLGGNGWILSTVFNKRHEHRSAFMLGDPVPMMLDFLTIECPRSDVTIEVSDLRSQYKDKVKEKKYVSQGYNQPQGIQGHYSGFFSNPDWDFGNEYQGNTQPRSYASGIPDTQWVYKNNRWLLEEADKVETPKTIAVASTKDNQTLPHYKLNANQQEVTHQNGVLYFENIDCATARYIASDFEIPLPEKITIAHDPVAETDTLLKD